MSGASAEEIGRRVRALRERAGLSQADLADATGIAQPHIARLEGGAHDPSLRTLRAVAEALDVDLGALVSERTKI